MGLFSRKKKKVEEVKIPELPHEHCWKDFPWYMEVKYNSVHKTASYKIFEPYVCITCGERKDICLEKKSWENIDSESREKYYKDVQDKYKAYLKPVAIVEDMINNVLLVKDAAHLEMVEKLIGSPHRNCGTSAEMKQVDTEFKINLPKKKKGVK